MSIDSENSVITDIIDKNVHIQNFLTTPILEEKMKYIIGSS